MTLASKTRVEVTYVWWNYEMIPRSLPTFYPRCFLIKPLWNKICWTKVLESCFTQVWDSFLRLYSIIWRFFAATLAKLQPQISQNGPQATEKSRLEKNISYVRLRQCWKSAAEAAFKSIQFANTSAENLVWNLQIRSATFFTSAWLPYLQTPLEIGRERNGYSIPVPNPSTQPTEPKYIPKDWKNIEGLAKLSKQMLNIWPNIQKCFG